MNIERLITRASKSKFQLWKLNRILWLGIPFNKPHKFRIKEIELGYAKISLPYKRSNLNHLKTIHACAMATCSEYVCGLVLGTRFSFNEYRLIMREIHMEYHYQGKMDAFCEFQFSKDEFEQVQSALNGTDAHDIQLKINCIDKEGNHLSTATVVWQIKPWSKTKSKKS